MPEPPVLRDVRTIENRDALIDWDRCELDCDKFGRPITRWDGETMKKHPVTGKDVPDETARVEVYRYINPKSAKWPKADFIIGNPPFIGDKAMRERLGEGYLNALFRTTQVPESADFVMHWWGKAALRLRKHQVRRFGFVTTNSLSQTFNRRVLESHLAALDAMTLVFAIPDHPWVSEKGDAAVRISMTVCAQGKDTGALLQVCDESEAPEAIRFTERRGMILSDLSIGANVAGAGVLKSNLGVSSNGCALNGAGFIVSEETASTLIQEAGADIIRPYRNGRDLMGRPREVRVIDLYGHKEEEIRRRLPSVYQHLFHLVRPARLARSGRTADATQYAEQWWTFQKPRPRLRRALSGLNRYIATVETTKHRVFQFLDKQVLPDHMLIVVASSDAFILGVLSSRFHVVWALAAGGTLEDRPRYNKSRCFDPFPFPDTSDEMLKDRIRSAADKLDALRKEVLARHGDLTLTKLYNALDAIRAAEQAGTVISEKDRNIAERGCVSLIRQYHDEIDVLVAEAYCWPKHLSDEEVLELLVALNKERAAEEAKGKIRWLRPEFQAPGYVTPAEQVVMALPDTEKPSPEILEWPGALPEQVTAVASVVMRAGRPVAANDVARAFKGKRTASVIPVLDALAGMGQLRKLEDGRYAA